MQRPIYVFIAFFLALFPVLAPFAKAQGTHTAASCNQSDVNAVINGPTHTAVDGDTIIIPPGSCTWTSGITVPSGIGISIIGAGTPNTGAGTFGAGTSTTKITFNSTGSIFAMNPVYGNSTSRISLLTFLPGTAVALFPITVVGTCAAGGCPNIRLDNLVIPTSWIGHMSTASFGLVGNMFGVIDHNTVGDTNPGSSYLNFLNVGHASWQGVGAFGDNSWASPDTFGTAQTLFLENNIFNWSQATDTVSGAGMGGARFACRFNQAPHIGPFGICTGHGTDTTGRPRGNRQWEGYWNTGTCDDSHTGCGSAWTGRSGVGMSFANTFTNSGSGYFKGLADLTAQRRWRPDQPWGPCDGSAPWDTNQGTIYYNGTIGSLSGGGSAPWTVIHSGSPGWTTNQWVQWSGAPYSMHDVTLNGGFEIAANTANSVTANQPVGSGAGAYNPVVNDSYQILKALVCMDQPTRSGGNLVQNGPGGDMSPVLASTGNPGPVNQSLDPIYEAADSLPSSTADHTIWSVTASLLSGRDFYAEGINQPAQTSSTTPFNGKVDFQPISSWTCTSGPDTCTVTVPSTSSFVVNGYAVINGTLPGSPNNRSADIVGGNVTALTATTITYSNPRVYTDTGRAGGTITPVGMGHGTLTNRPTTCTAGVGYWATDQGHWNTFDSSKEGVLYICTATDAWTLSYTPYSYPHPLIAGGSTGSGGNSLHPPTGVKAIVQ